MRKRKEPWMPEESADWMPPVSDQFPEFDGEAYRRNDRVIRTDEGFRRADWGGVEKVTVNPPVQGRRWRKFTS